jgi:hypothetical protein
MTDRVGGYCCRGVLLDDVIEHLQMDGDYYKKKTMMVQVGETHPVY